MLQNIKAVIFDLDGTLVDSMWVWKQVDLDYLGAKNLTMPPTLQKDIEGCSMRETALFFQKHLGIRDSVEQMMQEWNALAMDAYAHRVTFKPGAETFLKDLRKRSVKTGIATSNSRELVENILKVHHIKEFFSCILTGSEITNGKPAPDIYLAAAKELNVAPKDCLVFEDIIPGIQAGINAGMKVCAVEDEYSFASRKEKIKLADYYIENYLEILDSN